MTRSMAIKWRLASVMADRELNYKEVAKRTGLHPITVNKLKNTFVAPPRLESGTLDKLCRVLSCQPGDLMRYEPNLEATHDRSLGDRPNHPKA